MAVPTAGGRGTERRTERRGCNAGDGRGDEPFGIVQVRMASVTAGRGFKRRRALHDGALDRAGGGIERRRGNVSGSPQAAPTA